MSMIKSRYQSVGNQFTKGFTAIILTVYLWMDIIKSKKGSVEARRPKGLKFLNPPLDYCCEIIGF